MAITIDLSLANGALYDGCKIDTVGGRSALVTDPVAASNIVGANAGKIIDAVAAVDRDEVVLTGPMAVWAYLVVFHQVVHRFKRVVYDDGRGGRVLIAQH
jgi:hypothetical protein